MVLCICVLMVVIFLIQMYDQKTKLISYYPDTTTFMYDMQKEELKEEIGIPEKWLYSYHVLSSLFLVSSERVLLFECKVDKKDEVIEKVHAYIEKLKKQFENSDEIQWINQYQEYTNDRYYVVVISKNAKQIMDDIKRRMFH